MCLEGFHKLKTVVCDCHVIVCPVRVDVIPYCYFVGTKFSDFATLCFQCLNLAATKDFKTVTIP